MWRLCLPGEDGVQVPLDGMTMCVVSIIQENAERDAARVHAAVMMHVWALCACLTGASALHLIKCLPRCNIYPMKCAAALVWASPLCVGLCWITVLWGEAFDAEQAFVLASVLVALAVFYRDMTATRVVIFRARPQRVYAARQRAARWYAPHTHQNFTNTQACAA